MAKRQCRYYNRWKQQDYLSRLLLMKQQLLLAAMRHVFKRHCK